MQFACTTRCGSSKRSWPLWTHTFYILSHAIFFPTLVHGILQHLFPNESNTNTFPPLTILLFCPSPDCPILQLPIFRHLSFFVSPVASLAFPMHSINLTQNDSKVKILGTGTSGSHFNEQWLVAAMSKSKLCEGQTFFSHIFHWTYQKSVAWAWMY